MHDVDKCRICGRDELDGPWEALLAGREPGPNMLSLGRARHSNSGLTGSGRWMPDDYGVPRCIVCLAEVPKARAMDTGRIGVTRLMSGYELMCCGWDARPVLATGSENREDPDHG